MRAFVLSEKRRRKKICAVELDLSCDKDTSTARKLFNAKRLGSWFTLVDNYCSYL